jgi:hypothetical protein
MRDLVGLLVGDNRSGCEWSLTAEGDVDQTVCRADAPLHPDGDGWEEDGDEAEEDVAAAHGGCAVSFSSCALVEKSNEEEGNRNVAAWDQQLSRSRECVNRTATNQ